MGAHSDPKRTQTFLEIACSQALLTPEAAEEVSREIDAAGGTVTDVVLRKGVLDSVQVEIVESLLRPAEAFPGYEILDVIGRGGMGVVYRARQKNLNREVAIKTVLVSGASQAAAVARFEKEAVTVAGLRHPNIVIAYDFGRLDGRLYFVMELLEGEDLDSRISRMGPIDERATWEICRQAAWGLAHAAERGMVHRDVKPANLFLVQKPEGSPLPAGVPMVKITDFGLVLSIAEDESARLTRVGTSLGTPTYMAPEQFSTPLVDSRADIYALGASAFHMLTGRPPFSGDSLWQIMSAKLQGELPDLDRIASRRSADLLRDMLAVDPQKRIANYSALLARIGNIVDFPHRRELKTWRSLPTVSLPTFCRRGRGRWAFLGAFVALMVLAASWWAWQARSPAEHLTPIATYSLFNGQTLAHWQPQEGTWSIAKDAEGGLVLAGRGAVKRDIPNMPNYFISMGVDLHEAQAVELHFGFLESGKRNVLRYEAGFLELGERLADHGAWQSRSQRLPLPRHQAAEAASPYVELRVERSNSTWSVYCDDRLLGTMAAQPANEWPEFQLVTEGGTAYFEDLAVYELGKTAAARPR